MPRDLLGRFFRGLQKLEAHLLAWSMIVLAVLTIANVFSRALLDTSLAFAEELSQFLMVFVTFVGLAYGASVGRHIRMTALYDQLPLRARRLTMVGIAGATSALCFVLGAYAVDYVETVLELGTVSSALQIPMWMVHLAAPLGFFLAGVEYALTVVQNLRSDDVYLSFAKKDEYEPAEGAASSGEGAGG